MCRIRGNVKNGTAWCTSAAVERMSLTFCMALKWNPCQATKAAITVFLFSRNSRGRQSNSNTESEETSLQCLKSAGWQIKEEERCYCTTLASLQLKLKMQLYSVGGLLCLKLKKASELNFPPKLKCNNFIKSKKWESGGVLARCTDPSTASVIPRWQTALKAWPYRITALLPF